MISEKAYAKLNISLDVSSPREDGYHDMLMVMQTVSFCDEVILYPSDDGKISARTGLYYIPGDDRNLAVKAARLFLRTVGREEQGYRIEIHKQIPVGAGMAGGSADAAAVLRALNQEYGNPLPRNELLALSAQVGSDVPFCLLGGTALAQGRGEILTPLSPLPACRILIVKPSFSVSTPELFHAIDSVKLKIRPDTQGIAEALDAGDLSGVARRMYNVFEDVPDRRMRLIAEIKSRLLDAGALGSIMTGTGSAVFALFRPDTDFPESFLAEFEKEYGFCVTAEPVGALLEDGF